MRIYALSDIHGMHDMLIDALGFIEKDCPGECTVMFLGDYVDRGPKSRQVIATLMRGPTNPLHKWIFLRGNHDDMMMREVRNGERMGWSDHYGAPTLASYFVDSNDSQNWKGYKLELLEHVEWINKLPFYYYFQEQKLFFVHAGLRPHVPLVEQNEYDMIWERNEYSFLTGNYDFGFTVVHGHTPRPQPEVQVPKGWDRPRRIDIDSGACFGKDYSENYGFLTLAKWGDANVDKFPEFYRVDGVAYPSLVSMVGRLT